MPETNKAGFNAQYAINPKRNYYYVYLLQAADKRKAASFMMKLRVETEYKDAWMFYGRLGADAKDAETPVEPTLTPVQPEPVHHRH